MHPIEHRDDVRTSRCLSRMLRHRPDIPHDGYGWFLVDDIVRYGDIPRERVLEIADSDTRYEVSPDGERIRASHGHSIEITYESETVPPEVLYHGTSPLGFEGILRTGTISRMGRTKVHLSDDPEKAVSVGRRHSKDAAILLKVHSGRMHRAGMRFNLSEDGVYLTDRVPIRYVERVSDGPVRHTMHISSQSFDRMLEGTRKVEMRLYDDKRRMMMLGDSILFSCDDRSMAAVITGLHRYRTFSELYSSIPKTMLGYHEDEPADPKDMSEIYDESRAEELGVIGIEFALNGQM